ncbi:hypothetical protein KU735_23055, partial [Salmonella enterica subsp. enterica serovar Give]|nr:hypothetical protein [Salmonella enterica subsp. enterica serovar Give]
LISLSLFKTRTFSVGIAGNLATRLGTGCVPFLMPLMLQVGFGGRLKRKLGNHQTDKYRNADQSLPVSQTSQNLRYGRFRDNRT